MKHRKRHQHTLRPSKPSTIRILQLETLLAMIRNSVGSRMFQTLYASVDGKKRDLLDRGKYSCAAYVSWMLYHFRLIKEPHVTVEGTESDLRGSGWRRSARPLPGDVIIWEAIQRPDGSLHRHIGFSVGDMRAISNDPRGDTPIAHHRTFGTRRGQPVRRITAIYRLPAAGIPRH